MKKLISIVLLLALITTGCMAHMHKVGQGAQTNEKDQARQWYILFGLVPLNDVDTSEMAGEEKDYTIKTESSALDILIGLFTTWVTIGSRTVTVTK
jgi:hypothetical protein